MLERVSRLADREDAAQTVLERLLRNPRPVSEGYLVSAIRNASIDLWRAHSSRARHEHEYAVAAQTHDTASPYDAYHERELADAVEFALGSLCELDQEIFERSYAQGQSAVEIARDLGLNHSTVSKRLAKIKSFCWDTVYDQLDED
ncbi:MAG: sigma-70 family RNA polymerase sigma factor [Myxococcota bacterium]